MLQSFQPTLDSMEEVIPLERLPCANRDLARKWNCPNEGKLFCSSCRLVAYCAKVFCVSVPSWPIIDITTLSRVAKKITGKDTSKARIFIRDRCRAWTICGVDCKNKLLSPSWQPAWVIENRNPSFITSSGPNDLDSARMEYFRDKASQRGMHMHLYAHLKLNSASW